MTRRETGVIASGLASAIAHVGALAFAAIALAPGVQASPIARRAELIGTHTGLWIAGWSAFAIAGVLLVIFLVLLGRALAERGIDRGTTLGIVLGLAGLLVEVSGHAISVLAIPAAARHRDLAALADLETLAALLDSSLAQPLFGASTLVFVRLVAAARGPRVAVAAGAINVLGAAVMTVAATRGWKQFLPVATAIVILSLAVFQITIVVWIRRSRGDSHPNPSVQLPGML